MDSAADPTHLTTEELYDALANDRRRACVREIAAREGWVNVNDVAEAIAEREAEGEPPSADSIYISLIQVHMPKLDEYDIVAYDDDDQIVIPDEAFAETIDCLEYHSDQGAGAIGFSQKVGFVTALGLLVAILIPTIRGPVLGAVLIVQLAAIASTVDDVRDTLEDLPLPVEG